jgi:hypothetical protein
MISLMMVIVSANLTRGRYASSVSNNRYCSISSDRIWSTSWGRVPPSISYSLSGSRTWKYRKTSVSSGRYKSESWSISGDL